MWPLSCATVLEHFEGTNWRYERNAQSCCVYKGGQHGSKKNNRIAHFTPPPQFNGISQVIQKFWIHNSPVDPLVTILFQKSLGDSAPTHMDWAFILSPVAVVSWRWPGNSSDGNWTSCPKIQSFAREALLHLHLVTYLNRNLQRPANTKVFWILSRPLKNVFCALKLKT